MLKVTPNLLLGLLDVSTKALEQAQPFARVVTLKDNTVLYFQDDPTDRLFFVKHGYVRLCYISEDGLVTLHSIVPPGRSFGEAGALEQFGYCDTAFALGAAEVIALDLECMTEHNSTHDEIRIAISKIIARSYRDHVEFTRGLYRSNMAQRLSYSLLKLLDILGNQIKYRGQTVHCIGPVVTQRDLGAMARGTRENVNKALRNWQKQGIIVMEDRHIIVLDRPKLERVSVDVE